MKTSLDHLPELKRAQLRAITSIFCESAPAAMLILFGSHARGDWVQDPETGYRSDFDLIAIVETEKQAEDLPLWSDLERRARGRGRDACDAHRPRYQIRQPRDPHRPVLLR